MDDKEDITGQELSEIELQPDLETTVGEVDDQLQESSPDVKIIPTKPIEEKKNSPVLGSIYMILVTVG